MYFFAPSISLSYLLQPELTINDTASDPTKQHLNSRFRCWRLRIGSVLRKYGTSGGTLGFSMIYDFYRTGSPSILDED